MTASVGIDDLLRRARTRLTRLTPHEAHEAAGRDGMIVDIRSEAQRLSQGLVPGALFVPRNSLEWRVDPSCEFRDPRVTAVAGPLVLMCAQGFQSSLAAATLHEIGVTRATDMIGGFAGWQEAGLRVLGPGPADADGRRRHWDRAYEDRGAEDVSWFEASPATSLAMIDGAGAPLDQGAIDVGGGASPLAGALLARGAADVTVLDVSQRALDTSRDRLGPDGARVRWILADVLDWLPERSFGLWHDRAVLHFLVDPAARERYRAAARTAVAPGGLLVIGGFAEDGPETCSGLPVARRSAAALVAEFAHGFALVAERRHEHRTPRGTAQAFTWVALRRSDA